MVGHRTRRVVAVLFMVNLVVLIGVAASKPPKVQDRSTPATRAQALQAAANYCQWGTCTYEASRCNPLAWAPLFEHYVLQGEGAAE